MNNFINQMEPHFDENEANACYEYMKGDIWLTEFKKTQELEKMICNFTGSKYCHMVNNGTISLTLALLALDVKKNDKVIVPDFTMIATPNSVRLLGAEPVFVDVESETLCLDINKTEELLMKDKSIKCVIHVSLNARCNNINRLVELCKKYKVGLLEDSAQSLGSFSNGKHLGTYGDIGSFSFSSQKIISTGQGGALVTNSDELSRKIYNLKNFGRFGGGNDNHDYFGINCKFTDIQAVIGIEQMKKLPGRINRIKAIWNIYYERLCGNNNIFMFRSTDKDWIPWFIDIYIECPIKLKEYLKENNIGTRLVYPPIHTQKVYSEYNNESFPITEKYSSMGLWLPSSTNLTNEQINYVCDKILEFY